MPTTDRKRRAEALPGPQGRKKTTLLGTNPDRYYFRFPRASVISPDFHWLAVLNPSIRTHAGKTGHSDFNLKFRASGEKAVSFHWIVSRERETLSGGLQTTPLALVLCEDKKRHLTRNGMPNGFSRNVITQ